MAIDPRLLPNRALVDSSVLVAALDPNMRGKEADDSREFWATMLTNGNQIVLAAPTIAEFIVGRDFQQVPRTRGISVVAFDIDAARFYADRFPKKVLIDHRDASGRTKTSVKFDSMIIACALRHRVGHFVTLDVQQAKLASAVGLKAHTPSDFEAQPEPEPAQATLFEAPPRI